MNRKELSFSSIITLEALCQMKIEQFPTCECLELSITCLHCRAKIASAELTALLDQIADDLNGPTKPEEAS